MINGRRLFSKIGANYLILAILAIVFQIIIVNIINITKPELLYDMNILTLLSSVCNYILPFPIFYWLMKKLETVKIEKSKVTVKTFIIYISIAITLMWIGNIIGLIITAVLSGAIQSQISNPVQELINNTDIWFNILIISILAPICEELFFRKLLIDRTIKYGARVSIILSAVIFALFHGNLNQFFYALLLGGFFAYVYIKTGRIVYTMVLHSIVNIMGSVISIIIGNAVMNLISNFNNTDALILVVYLVCLVIFLIIGIYGLSKYKKAKFNGAKTQVQLRYPYNTMFINYGMLLFIGWFVFSMIRQIFAV